MTDSQPPFSKF